MSNIIIYGEPDEISTVNRELTVQKEGNREVSRENLLHRCLIVKAKNEVIIQEKPLKPHFVDRNLFDCCLIGHRNSVERLG